MTHLELLTQELEKISFGILKNIKISEIELFNWKQISQHLDKFLKILKFFNKKLSKLEVKV